MTELRPSGIRAVFDRAIELERAGRDIVHLEIGRPHLGSPEVAVQAAIAALQAGRVHYTPNRGLPELRDAIAQRAGRHFEEVIVTAGGSEAVAAAVLAALGPGDEAIILDPAWPHYDGHVRLAGGVPVHVPCAAADGFQPDPERVAAAVSPRTRLLIVSSPSNPTGAVFERARIAELAELCRRHDLVALSDEIYAGFLYDGAQHHSISELAQRTIVADSCSKTWSMTGWRVGWAIAPEPLAGAINAVHQHVGVCAPTFAQAGALAALREGDEHAQAMVAEYAQRRDEVTAALGDAPAGALYAFPRIGDVALDLLEEAGVAVVPGSVFGEGFDEHVRLCFAVGEDELRAGLERIQRFLAT